MGYVGVNRYYRGPQGSLELSVRSGIIGRVTCRVHNLDEFKYRSLEPSEVGWLAIRSPLKAECGSRIPGSRSRSSSSRI